VISENLGGMVSLDLEGNFGKIGIDWGDGLGGEVIENRGSIEKVSHAYWVERNRNFRIKLVHAKSVNKTDGGVIWCKDSQWLTLQVSPSNEASVVSVPDVFTPNGDGLNETFYVEMAKPLSYEITILDAKQRTVFRSNDYTEVWTGICGNRECDEANYRVILAYKYSGDKEWKYIRKSIKLLRKPINNIQN
jgi:gliding motility-associated-like protein